MGQDREHCPIPSTFVHVRRRCCGQGVELCRRERPHPCSHEPGIGHGPPLSVPSSTRSLRPIKDVSGPSLFSSKGSPKKRKTICEYTARFLLKHSTVRLKAAPVASLLFVSRALLLRLGLDGRFLPLGYRCPTTPTELGRGRDPSPTPRTESHRGFGNDLLGVDPAIAAKLGPLG
jgi:hypothetical protein